MLHTPESNDFKLITSFRPELFKSNKQNQTNKLILEHDILVGDTSVHHESREVIRSAMEQKNRFHIRHAVNGGRPQESVFENHQ